MKPAAAVLPETTIAPGTQAGKAPVYGGRRSTLGHKAVSLAGWLWRWLAGAALCLNTFTSILVAGWTYRWLQALVLRGWWQQSRLAAEGSFDDFLASLGPSAPVAQPRWLLRERIAAVVRRRAPDAVSAGRLRLAGRLLTVPWHSAWLNLKTGIQAVFCTYVLTGWGCVVMYFGWEYGWLNSFHKGYEQALTGLGISLLGVLLFVLSLLYVPMAQVHQAVTGEARAFFDFRFVWQLIRARLTAYCGVAALIVLATLPLEILKLLPRGFGDDPSLTDAEVLTLLRQYLFGCCLLLFPLLLLVRRAAARVYRSAVLKVLRQGTVRKAELHPVPAGWLERLELTPVPVAAPTGLAWAVRAGGRWSYRRLAFVLLCLTWLPFVAAAYVGEFFQRHRGSGFVNHVLIQLPAFDLVPAALVKAGAEEQGVPATHHQP
jgi:hypothetical protein